MRKKLLILLFLTLIPVYFALAGFANITDSTKRANVLVHELIVNPEIMIFLGMITGLLLREKRAMWWGMLVCFLYSYLALGLIWGGFAQEGLFGRNTLNTAALLSVFGFAAAGFMFLVLRAIRKLLEASK